MPWAVRSVMPSCCARSRSRTSRSRSTAASTSRWFVRKLHESAMSVELPFMPKTLADEPPISLEAVVGEVLQELQIHVRLTAPVLLDAEQRELPELVVPGRVVRDVGP